MVHKQLTQRARVKTAVTAEPRTGTKHHRYQQYHARQNTEGFHLNDYILPFFITSTIKKPLWYQISAQCGMYNTQTRDIMTALRKYLLKRTF